MVTLLDLQAAKVVDQHLLWPIIGLLGLLLLLVLGFALVIERVLLSPLHRLQDSAQLIANGQYDLVLPKPSRDEIGDLSRAFSTMFCEIAIPAGSSAALLIRRPDDRRCKDVFSESVDVERLR